MEMAGEEGASLGGLLLLQGGVGRGAILRAAYTSTLATSRGLRVWEGSLKCGSKGSARGTEHTTGGRPRLLPLRSLP